MIGETFASTDFVSYGLKISLRLGLTLLQFRQLYLLLRHARPSALPTVFVFLLLNRKWRRSGRRAVAGGAAPLKFCFSQLEEQLIGFRQMGRGALHICCGSGGGGRFKGDFGGRLVVGRLLGSMVVALRAGLS